MANQLTGTIAAIDQQGNLVTDLTAEQLSDLPTDDSLTIHCDGHETHGLFTNYGDQPPMTLMAVIGDSGNLEIAIAEDSAKIMLGVAVGTPVKMTW